MLHRDRWGNLFYVGDDDMEDGPPMMQQPEMPIPIAVTGILKARPSDHWMSTSGRRTAQIGLGFCPALSEGRRGGQSVSFHRADSPPPIPESRELVKEFLKVWARNHNPNANKDYTNPYMFMYGFERRSESIPLTLANRSATSRS